MYKEEVLLPVTNSRLLAWGKADWGEAIMLGTALRAQL